MIIHMIIPHDYSNDSCDSYDSCDSCDSFDIFDSDDSCDSCDSFDSDDSCDSCNSCDSSDDDTYDASFCFDGKYIPLNTPHAGAPAQGERITAEAVSLGLFNMVCTFRLTIWKHCLSIESSRKWCSHC